MDKFILGVVVLYLLLTFGILCFLYETMQELKKLLKEFINKLNK